MICTVNRNGIYFPNDLILILQLTIINLAYKMTNFTQKMLIAAPKPLKNIYDDYSVLFIFFLKDLQKENTFLYIQLNKVCFR